MESPFAGQPVDLSLPDVLWRGDFRPVDEIPAPERHAAGYELFAERVEGDGTDLRALAADVRLLADYLHRHGDALRAGGDALLDSAAVFLGNALIARVRDGRWQAVGSGQPEVGQSRGGGGAEAFKMARLLTASDGLADQFEGFLQQWDAWHAAEQARAGAEQRAEQRLVLRSDAVLPAVAFRRDPDVHLVDLLDGLIEYLTHHYLATATTVPAQPGDPCTISPTVRTIRVIADSPDAAPLLIAVDDVGAIAIRAGAVHDFFFYGPNAADLESTLLAVAAGLYRETYPATPNDFAGYRLGTIDDPESFCVSEVKWITGTEHVPAIAEQLDALPTGWKSWPLRPRRST